jgi:light-regulated signal transduction histidine kinase (bacteriophytochrome)
LSPHGICLLWRPELIWLHLISDAVIGLAYFSIPVALAVFQSKRRDVNFGWVIWSFAIFIVSCGATHFFSIWTLYVPDYGAEGLLKAVTAVASLTTAIALWPLLPKALAIPSVQQLQETNDALRLALAERDSAMLALQDKNLELESVVSELEAFSYTVSHDLRAPLRSIDGFSQIVLKNNLSQLSKEVHNYLRLIRENASRMGKLIDDLLAFSRLGRQPLAKHPVRPERIVDQVVAEERLRAGARAVSVQMGEMPQVLADAALLKQVFVNLVNNAFKYTRMREAAVVEIGCGETTGEKVFFVRDNGAGFDMRYTDKLFGVFQRLHRYEEFEGTGVGLAIVQRILVRHGGRIWAEAAPGQGATFYFTVEPKHV